MNIDRDEHGRAPARDPADELVELMYEHFPRADANRMHAYLNRLHDETFALRRKLATKEAA